ncbi:MAG: alpha-L-rhamnosidase C-terminal domain-containing protein [Chthoniobacterales bacterium]
MSGKVPTPHGPVGVAWEKSPSPRFTIDVPQGATAEFVLPGCPPETLSPGRHIIPFQKP